MYLYLSKSDADLVKAILLKAQIKCYDDCMEQLINESMNGARYDAARYAAERLELILAKFER